MDREAEACRIVILMRGTVVDVAAPMKHKDLCYDILKDARKVIDKTSAAAFSQVEEEPRIVIVMNMAGRVDVAAPLPNLQLCHWMLGEAKGVIERYNDAAPIPLRPFPDRILGI